MFFEDLQSNNIPPYQESHCGVPGTIGLTAERTRFKSPQSLKAHWVQLGLVIVSQRSLPHKAVKIKSDDAMYVTLLCC